MDTRARPARPASRLRRRCRSAAEPHFCAARLLSGDAAPSRCCRAAVRRRPVEDLSFERMGKSLDKFVGDVEHETDFRNLLSGKTYAERDIKSMIRGKSAPPAAQDKPMASRGALKSSAPKAEHETPLKSHWVKAPHAEPVKTTAQVVQETLRALGGPEVVYSASKKLRRRHAAASPGALRMHRARAMRTDAGASRELGTYFAHAHSAVSEQSAAVPFAKERVWTLGTEKADMNNYFDNLEARTEKHVQEITNVHHAVEPSTKWQDGLESRADRAQRLLQGDGHQAKAVLGQAANVLSLARSDLHRWKRAQPGTLH